MQNEIYFNGTEFPYFLARKTKITHNDRDLSLKKLVTLKRVT
ncbi:protein of unknown function [Xenorhabdus poinarii G6]|uniref:Uncharacterized protein n=1 Tax=Xenorhabdus poinarii G6 TaxID=1354304 RepID=A0A068QZ54_9GAMM|nr:protein of unknown function [Xenorhabdus poinarii G6]